MNDSETVFFIWHQNTIVDHDGVSKKIANQCAALSESGVVLRLVHVRGLNVTELLWHESGSFRKIDKVNLIGLLTKFWYGTATFYYRYTPGHPFSLLMSIVAYATAQPLAFEFASPAKFSTPSSLARFSKRLIQTISVRLLRKSNSRYFGATLECVPQEIRNKQAFAIGNAYSVAPLTMAEITQATRLRKEYLEQCEVHALYMASNLSNFSFDHIRQSLKNVPGTIYVHVAGSTEAAIQSSSTPRFKILQHGFCQEESLKKLALNCHIGLGNYDNRQRGMSQTANLKIRDYIAFGLPVIMWDYDQQLEEFEALDSFVLKAIRGTEVREKDAISLLRVSCNDYLLSTMLGRYSKAFSWHALMQTTVVPNLAGRLQS
ncbi:MAG: hypothetical protein ACRBBR_16330 [Cellvibrionaceae bacterium]